MKYLLTLFFLVFLASCGATDNENITTSTYDSNNSQTDTSVNSVNTSGAS